MNQLATLTTDEELLIGSADSTGLDLFFERQHLEQSLYAYVQAAWAQVEPSQTFIPNWHIEELCRVLEDVYYARIKRVVINVPPGTLKSLLIEVFFPTWVWAKKANKRFLTASYGQHLTTRDNLRARQIIESPWFQDRWPVKLLEDQNTKTRYYTHENGWRIASSVNGQGIGEHPDFIIIDDPTTAPQAESDAERTTVNDWFDRTISTRLGRNPAIIVVMQRLHEDDLSGHLLKRGGWEHICWPMESEATRPATQDTAARASDPRDQRTVDGELLFPALFPVEKVTQLKLDLGPYGTAGQLQQRPAPEGGGQFKREWFAGKFVDAAPKYIRVARGWDTAGTEKGGDYTVGCKMGEELELLADPKDARFTSLKPTGRFYILDIQRDQLSPDGVDKLMRATAELDGKECAQREEKEGGASGVAVVMARAKLLKGFDYQAVNLGANKVVRAKPFRSQCEAGNVFLVRGPWNGPFIQELTLFPMGNHDDQVDGASCAFNSVLLIDPKPKQSAVWGTRR